MDAIGKLMSKRGTKVVPGADLSGLEKLDLIGITLLSDSGGGRRREVPGLGLRFDGNGLGVLRQDGSLVVQIPWVSLRRLEADLRTPKGGQPRVELGVESDRKRHLFVVPNVDPEVLRGSLGAMSARYARSGLVDVGKQGLRLR